MLVATTTTIDKTTRTVRHMAEAQRDAYEALTENLAAAQSRSIGLANDGLEFMRLQEDTAKAVQEWFANSVRLLQLQQDRKSTRLNSSHANISYAVFCLKKKKILTHC